MPPSTPPPVAGTACRSGHLRRSAIVLLAGAALTISPAMIPLAGPLGGLGAPAAQAAPADAWPLLVTEIAPDTVSHDEFEFFEVTNITDAPITVGGEGGHSFSYIYADA